ncbi:MAG: hypothetical protein JXR76_05630 [Deltaproteobacteria bacterium]|nr:hypothetical protein [Deltaproteobacteria bacterium]
MGNHKQVLTLTAIFIIAAVIGLIAWGVDCGLSPALHHLLVEVHDKLTLLLFVFPVMHVWKRRQRIELFNLKR